MVDIINFSLAVRQFDKVFDDSDYIFFCQDLDVGWDFEAEFAVDAVAADFAEVITFVGEEQFLYYSAGGFLIRGFRIAKLAVDVFNGFFLRVCCIFL